MSGRKRKAAEMKGGGASSGDDDGKSVSVDDDEDEEIDELVDFDEGEEPSPSILNHSLTSMEWLPRILVVNGSDNPSSKPPYSYASLITFAIKSVKTKDKKMTLSEIYKWIEDNFPYYRTAGSKWKNSVRHNLSLCKTFAKVPRDPTVPGKGSYWCICEENADSSSAAGDDKHGASKKRRSTDDKAKSSPRRSPSQAHDGKAPKSTAGGASATKAAKAASLAAQASVSLVKTSPRAPSTAQSKAKPPQPDPPQVATAKTSGEQAAAMAAAAATPRPGLPELRKQGTRKHNVPPLTNIPDELFARQSLSASYKSLLLSLPPSGLQNPSSLTLEEIERTLLSVNNNQELRNTMDPEILKQTQELMAMVKGDATGLGSTLLQTPKFHDLASSFSTLLQSPMVKAAPPLFAAQSSNDSAADNGFDFLKLL